MQPRSLRTTVWGVIGGVAALLGFAVQWHATGQLPDFQQVMTVVTGLAVLLGLKAVADHKDIIDK